MARLLELHEIEDERGNLIVIDNLLPFNIKRVFYIYGKKGYDRGGHKHKKNRQALICINGECTIEYNNGKECDEVILNSSKKCLILEPEDWHVMKNFSESSILLVLASESYNKEDYIYERYEEQK